MSIHWPEGEERAFRGAPHRWTYNERLMVAEIDALRARIARLEAERVADRVVESEVNAGKSGWTGR